MEKIQYLRNKTQSAKRKVLEMCVSAGKGHLTSAYSCAEILTTLYYDVMRIDPKNPAWPGRDWFIMSKNHGSVMQYPILADLGYFDKQDLDTYMCDGGKITGHSHYVIEGIETSGGSLGIGLGIACGVAYALKMDNKDNLVFALIGDGESYEGSIWESSMFAAHNKLGNLITILDRNRLCCTDFTENILTLEPIVDKWRSFGWEVKEVDGHDVEQLLSALVNIHGEKRQKPLMIIANTVKGNGIDFMASNPLTHGVVPTGDNILKAFNALEDII
jgi:transketolase